MKLKNLVEVNCVRSSGAGGQNVNKVSSKVELRLDVKRLDENISARLLQESKRINKEGILVITCSETRDQHKNKELAFQKMRAHIDLMMLDPKDRIATTQTNGSKEKRLKSKKQHSTNKANRNNKDWE